ncbi:hypothetical protein KUTeg_012761 [Tegillarca granosa]|uniref:CAP-Gly domain-containing protein n=1 Tax=Tegillarca granosa TaxID=220873 RepID=A0ABQ9F0F8_TEGGR|nr:hypothetical protein KUTeg_012761 [Tegillarca granosa]
MKQSTICNEKSSFILAKDNRYLTKIRLKPLPPDFTHKFKMVLHHNINVGQRVEVKIGYNVFRGVVKYKGAVTNRRGDWVGVSLEVPGGDNDGMVQGRRYFQCRERHGIFVRASSIRFIPLYHKVADRSYVEEPLFKSSSPMFGNRQFHPLRHSVSNRIPAATMRRPKTAMSSFRYTTSPIHTEYDIVDEFITSPAIPKTHMPYTALRNQVRRGWDGAHYVREMSVGTGRDSMKFSQWNDISD